MCVIGNLVILFEAKLTLPAVLQIFPSKVHTGALEKPVQIFGLLSVLEKIWYSVGLIITVRRRQLLPSPSVSWCIVIPVEWVQGQP